MTVATVDIEGVERIRGEAEVVDLAAGSLQMFCDVLSTLETEEWEAPTVCEPWTVVDVARHVLGAVESHLSVVEMVKQQAAGARRRAAFDGNALDACNAFQVERRRHLTGPEVLGRLRTAAQPAAKSRARRARILGRLSVPLDQGGSSAAGMPDRLGLGELYRVTYTRDTWLHRLDVADALGRHVDLDTPVDRRIVEDVVKDWAERHGRPFEVRLSGSFDARYVRGTGGPVIEIDPARLCWILSGRADPDFDAPGADLLRSRVIF